jgi:hypothetical protein
MSYEVLFLQSTCQNLRWLGKGATRKQRTRAIERATLGPDHQHHHSKYMQDGKVSRHTRPAYPAHQAIPSDTSQFSIPRSVASEAITDFKLDREFITPLRHREAARPFYTTLHISRPLLQSRYRSLLAQPRTVEQSESLPYK